MKKIAITISILLFYGCSGSMQTNDIVFVPEVTSTDPSYGYSENNPVNLGGFLRGTEHQGYHNYYFEHLHGPNGETLEILRMGSCCEFLDESLPMGGGLLDKYELRYEGQKNPSVIYVNLYKYEDPKAPSGFLLSQ